MITLELGDRIVKLKPIYGMTGHLLSWQAKLAGDGASCIVASVEVVHDHGCAATLYGKRFGPCDCGGEALLEQLAKQCGGSMEVIP